MFFNKCFLLSHNSSDDLSTVDIWASNDQPHGSSRTQPLSRKLYVFFYDPNIFLIFICGLKCSPTNFFSVYLSVYLLYLCVVAVAKRYENYTLTCNSKPDDIVTWKLNGDPLEDEENVELNGQNLTVSDIDTPNLGDYSCWRGEEMLSSTYLLLKADEEDTIGEFLFHFSFILPFTCSKWWDFFN